MPSLLEQLKEVGFFASALLPAPVIADNNFQEFYNRWLKTKPTHVLAYLNQTEAKYNLEKIFPGVKTLLIALHSYRNKATEELLRKARYKIARYAWGYDYHKVLRKKLLQVLLAHGFKKEEFRIVVDTTPLNERYYARLANLGFLGRNGMLIHPQKGSYFFIALVLLTREMKAHPLQSSLGTLKADIDQWCGQCQLCVKACPTQALVGDGTMRVERCISQLTVENKAQELHYPSTTKKHQWIFGCDICQAVCPYNKKIAFISEKDFSPLALSQQVASGVVPSQREVFFGTALLRAEPTHLQRNIRAVEPFLT